MKSDVKLFIRGLEKELTYRAVNDKKLYLWWKNDTVPFMTFIRTGGEWLHEGTGTRFRTLKGAVLYGQRWAQTHL